MQATLIIMAKPPRLGRVKRRLGRQIGAVAATGFYRTCLERTLSRLARDRRWRSQLAVPAEDPAERLFWRRLAASYGLPLIGQGRGDLGRRMQRLLERAPPGPALLIGSDIPAIRPAHVAHAFRLARSADAVFGPAEDGGYWLIGFRHRRPIMRPFASVRWSSPHALQDSLATLREKRIAFAARLADIDDADAYLCHAGTFRRPCKRPEA